MSRHHTVVQKPLANFRSGATKTAATRTRSALQKGARDEAGLAHRRRDDCAGARGENREGAGEGAEHLAVIADIERSGVTSLNGIAKVLQARGVLTPRGLTTWYAAQLSQVKAMAAA